MRRPSLSVSLVALVAASAAVHAAETGVFFRGTDHSFSSPSPVSPGGGETPPVLPPTGGTQNETSSTKLTFEAVVDAKLGATVLSKPAIVTGPATIGLAASGGRIRVCASFDCAEGGSFSTSATASSGNYVQAEVEGPTAPGGSKTVVVTSGSFSTSFVATAASSDAGLTTVASAVGAEPGSTVESVTSGLYGYATARLAVTGGEQRRCTAGGGCDPWTTGTVVLAEGETVQLRTTAGPFGQTRRVVSSIENGGPSVVFDVTTRAVDRTPAFFSFAPATDLEPGLAATSAIVRPSGYDVADVAVSGGEYQICGAADCSDQASWRTTVTPDVQAGFFMRVRTPVLAFGENKATSLDVGGASATFVASTRGQDTVADGYAIASKSGVEPATTTTSEDVRPTGFEGTVTVSATGGEVSVDAGSTWAASRQLTVGGAFRVRVVSGAFSQTVSASVAVGTSTPATFSVTTRDRNTVPGSFSIASVSGAEPGVPVSSSAIRPTGIEGDATVSASTGGEISVDGGSTWAQSRTLTSGGSFLVRLVSSTFSATVSTDVVVGTGTPVPFSVATRAKDTTPATFSFASVSNVEPGTQAVSAIVRPTAYDSADVSVSGGDYQVCISADCSDQTVWRTAVTPDVQSGAYFRVRTPAAAYGETKSATLAVGGTSATFSAGGRVQDATPDAFSIASVVVDPGTFGVSASIRPVGYEGSVQVSASNGGEVSVDAGTSWAASRTLTAGGSFLVRVAGSSSYAVDASTSVVVGSGSPVAFVVRTRDRDTVPEAFSFAPVAGIEPSVVVSSADVMPIGFDGSLPVTVVGGEASVDLGATWSTTTTVAARGSLRLRTTSSASWNTPATATVTVGTGAPVTFTATTRYAPLAIANAPATGVLTGQSYTFDYTSTGGSGSFYTYALESGSLPVGYTLTAAGRLSGMIAVGGIPNYPQTSTFTVKVVDGAGTVQRKTSSMLVEVDVTKAYPYTDSGYTRGFANAGTSFFVTKTPLADSLYKVGRTLRFADGTTHTITALAVNTANNNLSPGFDNPNTNFAAVGYPNPISVEIDTLPNTFSIPAATGAEPSILTTSAAVAPTGLDAYDPTTVVVTGGEVTTDNGSTWGTSKSLPAGGSFKVRTTSSPTFGGTSTANVTVGTGTAVQFTVTTRAAVVEATTLAAFAPVYNGTTGSYSTSNVVALQGADSVSLSVAGLTSNAPGTHSSSQYRVCTSADCSDLGTGGWTASASTSTGNKYVQVRALGGTDGDNVFVNLNYGSKTSQFKIEMPYYAFSNHTFTPCVAGAGLSGPTLAQCQAAYSTTWESNTTYYTINDGIQYWRVPQTGTYTLTLYGAQGGHGHGGNIAGGLGRIFNKTLTLTKGTQLALVVPRQGVSGIAGRGGGGGGAAWVFTGAQGSGSLLAVAGGGGGGGGNNVGCNAHDLDSTGTIAGCTLGYGNAGTGPGGGGSNNGGGALGWLSPTTNVFNGKFVTGYGNALAEGGFGGGGMGDIGGGGGAGYTGGGGGNGTNNGTFLAGTGGGSGGSSEPKLSSATGRMTSGAITIVRN